MVRAGLIVPPLRGRVPPDAAELYPETDWLVEGVGLASLTGAAYSEAEGRVSEAAASLAERGAGAVLLFGTSLSFHRGPEGNAALESLMRDASGLPCMTLTTAMCHAMRLLQVRRMAVATAYTEEVNLAFRRYFAREGFQTAAIDGMDLTGLDAVEQTGRDAIEALSTRVWAQAVSPDALVISCAGLTTAAAAARLEEAFGHPVISSSMVGAWAAQGLAGGDTRAKCFGALYERKDMKWPSA